MAILIDDLITSHRGRTRSRSSAPHPKPSTKSSSSSSAPPTKAAPTCPPTKTYASTNCSSPATAPRPTSGHRGQARAGPQGQVRGTGRARSAGPGRRHPRREAAPRLRPGRPHRPRAAHLQPGNRPQGHRVPPRRRPQLPVQRRRSVTPARPAHGRGARRTRQVPRTGHRRLDDHQLGRSDRPPVPDRHVRPGGREHAPVRRHLQQARAAVQRHDGQHLAGHHRVPGGAPVVAARRPRRRLVSTTPS